MIERCNYKPEELDELSDLKNKDSLSDSQLDYLTELLPPNNCEVLAYRIDELTDVVPPKAIDANKNIAELIEPYRNEIDNRFFEAPNDPIQIEQISDAMCEIEGLRYEEWKEMSFEQRVDKLNELENVMAKISHRNPCPVYAESLGEGYFGYYLPDENSITINSDYIASNSPKEYHEVLDTLIHEGRHAYQFSNLTEREVHTNSADLRYWQANNVNYLDAGTFGMELYSQQPLEVDARYFAEEVLKQFNNKIV